MTDPITRTQLVNASVDSDNLGHLMNDAPGNITSRNGRSLYTYAKIQQLGVSAAAAAQAAAAAAIGLVYLFVDDLATLRNLPSEDSAVTPNAFLRTHSGLFGDGAAGAFIWNADDLADDDGATIIKPDDLADDAVGRWNRIIEGYISVNWWNPPIDQTGDASPMLRAAISAADYWETKEVRFFGRLHFTDQICNEEYGWTLPTGITFKGTGRQDAGSAGGASNNQSLWVYSGTADTYMFDLRSADGGGTGPLTNISFEDFYVACDVGNGFVAINQLRQNGEAYTCGIDPCPMYAQSIHFKNVKGAGHYDLSFLRGKMIFELEIDHNCNIAGFFRGLWLTGCDDASIRGRYDFNASRHIMLEKQGTFGNSPYVQPNFLGLHGGSDTTEDHYALYDTSESMTLVSPYVEVDGDKCKAIFYLNGSATNIMNAKIYGVGTPPPAFHLGPTAVNIKMLCPDSPTAYGIAAPIIDDQEPSTFLIDNQYDNYNILIIHPSTVFTSRVASSRRCCIVGGSTRLLGLNRAPLPQMGLSANGPGLARYQASAQDLGNAAPITDGMTGVITDSNAANYNGQAIQLPTVDADGLYWRFVCNRDFTAGDQIKAMALVRCTSTPGSGSLNLVFRKNGTIVGSAATTTSNVYVVLSKTLDTTGFSTGDTADVLIYNNGMSVAGLIGMMEWINTSHYPA